MYGMWDSNMFQQTNVQEYSPQTNVHEYSAQLQNENNNNVEYKSTPKPPEIFPETQIITSFDDLKINEWPGEIELQEYKNNSTEENDTEKIEKPKKIKLKKLKRLRTVHDPICVHHIPLEPEEIDSHMFAPVLRRKKKQDGCSPDSLVIDKNAEMNGYDSDETVNEYVECGREGMCKCRRMQGREYYEDYILMEGRDYLKLYSHGKRDFHYGTVLHFTGAPEHLKREDLYLALMELDATIEFLDYQKGSAEGWIRLSYPYEARVVIKKMENQKLRIGDAELTFNVLSGKEQKNYLKNVSETIFTLQELRKNRKIEKAGFKYA